MRHCSILMKKATLIFIHIIFKIVHYNIFLTYKSVIIRRIFSISLTLHIFYSLLVLLQFLVKLAHRNRFC